MEDINGGRTGPAFTAQETPIVTLGEVFEDGWTERDGLVKALSFAIDDNSNVLTNNGEDQIRRWDNVKDLIAAGVLTAEGGAAPTSSRPRTVKASTSTSTR